MTDYLNPYPQPYPPAPPPAPKTAGIAVASMVLGICSLVFCWWGIATLAMVTLAIVFGARSLHRPGRGMAIAGLTCGLVGALAYLAVGIGSGGVLFLI